LRLKAEAWSTVGTKGRGRRERRGAPRSQPRTSALDRPTRAAATVAAKANQA
jgi:hypothetical protein